MSVPKRPKIYHITHVDRLTSIVARGGLWCSDKVTRQNLPGTNIGMGKIKNVRSSSRYLRSHPGLRVGACVPFYFCPKSVMLCTIDNKGNGLSYKGGQGQIIHLEADLYDTVAWAEKHPLRWAFTLSNAAKFNFEDRCDLKELDKINWNAVQSDHWKKSKNLREGKQAEFLLEKMFSWRLVERIGVNNRGVRNQVQNIVNGHSNIPDIKVIGRWYYP